MQIITVPSQGPFRLGQTVQFSCLIDPIPPDPITYQWRMVEDYYGGTSSQQNFSRTYSIYSNGYMPQCYYSCEVLVNQTVLGSTSTLVELQGKLDPMYSCVVVFCKWYIIY